MEAFQGSRASLLEDDESPEGRLLTAVRHSRNQKNKTELPLYPHRNYPPVRKGQLSYVPVQYSLKKMGKFFVDFVKPYKSSRQLKNDFRQPLTGVVDMFSGTVMLFSGLFKLNGKRSLGGLFNLLLGVFEVVTTPLAWVIKPITRGIVTLAIGKPKIEENAGMVRLVHQGQEMNRKLDEKDLAEVEELHNLLAICEDLHRKFKKAIKVAQKTSIDPNIEQDVYEAILKKEAASVEKDQASDFHPLLQMTYQYLSLLEGKINSAEEDKQGAEASKNAGPKKF